MRLDGIRINPFTEALFVKRVDKEENKKEEVLKPDKPVRKSDEDIAVISYSIAPKAKKF